MATKTSVECKGSLLEQDISTTPELVQVLTLVVSFGAKEGDCAESRANVQSKPSSIPFQPIARAHRPLAPISDQRNAPSVRKRAPVSHLLRFLSLFITGDTALNWISRHISYPNPAYSAYKAGKHFNTPDPSSICVQNDRIHSRTFSTLESTDLTIDSARSQAPDVRAYCVANS